MPRGGEGPREPPEPGPAAPAAEPRKDAVQRDETPAFPRDRSNREQGIFEQGLTDMLFSEALRIHNKNAAPFNYKLTYEGLTLVELKGKPIEHLGTVFFLTDGTTAVLHDPTSTIELSLPQASVDRYGYSPLAVRSASMRVGNPVIGVRVTFNFESSSFSVSGLDAGRGDVTIGVDFSPLSVNISLPGIKQEARLEVSMGAGGDRLMYDFLSGMMALNGISQSNLIP